MTQKMIREAVGVFHAIDDMEVAIDELQEKGFDRAEISLLASEDTIREKLDHRITSTTELEDNPRVPVIPYLARESFGVLEGFSIGFPLYIGAILGFSPVIASGGAIAVAIAAGVLGGGGGAAIGGVLAYLIGKQHSDFLNSQLEKGGILVWVRTRDSAHEEKAKEILSRHSAFDVHIHSIPDKSSELSEHYTKAETGEAGPRMEYITYQNVQIAKAADGHCLALGRMFTSESEARRYIDFVLAEN
jgi:hypothetical protein